MNRTPEPSETQTQAAAWLVRLDAENSAATLAQWRQWLSEDARHRAAYLRLENSWHHADCLKNLQPLDGTVDASVLETFPGTCTFPQKRPPPLRPEVVYRTLAAALALISLVLAAWLCIAKPNRGVHRTELGGFERVMLPDGSTILLNTNSEIRVRFNSRRRAIALIRGEALFHVAPDARRPFDVEAGDTTVSAIGTSFAVRLQAPRRIEVLVAQGRVAIDPQAAPARPSTLAANEDATIDAGSPPHVERMDAEGMARKLAWTQGNLWFEQQTLAGAVAEFNHYNRRKLVLADPAIATLRIGGSFEATDPDAFVTALQHVFAIRAFPSPPDDPGGEVIRLLGPEPQFAPH